MIKYIYILLLSFLSLSIWSQDVSVIEGNVTFTTSQNTYVRFKNTASIQIGDTLSLNQSGTDTPCLIVTQKSSSSCVCISINDCSVSKGQIIRYKSKKEEKITKRKAPDTPLEEITIEDTIAQKDPIASPMFTERIRARFSMASYSNLSSQENRDNHRGVVRLSLNADHIQDSKFSLESYINYRKIQENASGIEGRKTSFLNVYNLAMTYDFDSTSFVSVGRKINRKISSIGPVDGIQGEKAFGDFYVGGIIGYKPDLSEFTLNTNLFEFGSFIGHQKRHNKLFTQTTIGLLEQQNRGQTDRRYSYLQHSSTIHKFHFFSSIEIDLFNKINNVTATDFRLTNLFLSARYRFNRKLSIMASYDSRKRILYYETYQSEIEKLLADDEARQGLRFRINASPIRYVNAGISYSKRFRNDSQEKSNNINGHISHSRILGSRVSINFNRNKSSYLQSQIYSINLSRGIIKGKLNGMAYMRIANYKYLNSETIRKQSLYGASLSFRISKKTRLSILTELSKQEDKQNLRINTKFIKRFDSK